MGYARNAELRALCISTSFPPRLFPSFLSSCFVSGSTKSLCGLRTTLVRVWFASALPSQLLVFVSSYLQVYKSRSRCFTSRHRVRVRVGRDLIQGPGPRFCACFCLVLLFSAGLWNLDLVFLAAAVASFFSRSCLWSGLPSLSSCKCTACSTSYLYKSYS